ncbi:MAG: ABC transporter permease [Ardenticatenaceae bacterium]|nr:ABC transporter permease [Ardenticatenaceae bacterium]
MSQFVIRRFLALIPVLLVVYTLTFLVIHATPGGPWDLETDRVLPDSLVRTLRAKYHLDDPLWKQYVNYIWGVLRGDFGPSYFSTLSVAEIIRKFWPVSIQLGVVAMGLALAIGIPLGVLAALRQNTLWDFGVTVLTLGFVSTPSYVLVTLLIVIFAVKLQWLPSGGWEGLLSKQAIIPAFALALGPAATLARYTRSSMLEALRMDYVRTARAKGLPERLVIARHVLKNALIPVVTVAGLSLAGVITGSFFVETIYRVPGIGRYFVTSASGRDYPVILGLTLLFAALIALANLLVDLLYGFLDPRITYK